MEELVADLERRGFRVAREAQLGDQRVDLLAERDGERLAFEIKARSRLTDSTGAILRLRQAARYAGLNEFRLVVVNPPHAVDVSIENLDAELLRYFSVDGTPEALDAMSSQTRIVDVTDVDIESVEVRPLGLHVRGRANAEVELTNSGGVEPDGLTTGDSVPFSFDLELGPDLKIMQVSRLAMDTTSFGG